MEIDNGSRHGSHHAARFWARFSGFFVRWIQLAGPTETNVLVITGLLVGVSAGLGAVAFRYLIDGFTFLFFHVLSPALEGVLGPAGVILLPAIGGLIAGPLIYFLAREAKGLGVPEVMMAVAMRGGRIRTAVGMAKTLASAICIGSGGAAGLVGPTVHLSATLGSAIGQVLRMSDDRTRTLVACGAAGGIAASFNAPIAGVFFAMEVILGEFTTRAFGIVVIASVTGSVIGRAIFGNVPAFTVPAYDLLNVGELGLYAILGVIAAFVGVGFTRALYWATDRFETVPLPEYVRPVIGGLLLGCIGLFLPQVFGVGYPVMDQALVGAYGLGLLLALMMAKFIGVCLTLGSGGAGGIFAPTLYIGSMLGTAFGKAAGMALPGFTAPAGAYGLVGMAAVFAGATRAPITAVIILFELTGDYRIILPLMVAVVISTLTSEALARDTIYTTKLRRRGIDLRAGRDIDLMRAITVSEAMTTEVPVLSSEVTAAEAGEQMAHSGDRAMIVVDEAGAIEGIVTIQDVERALLDNHPGISLGEIASRPVLTAFPDETLSQALRRMGVRDLGQLPVVTRMNPGILVGMLRRGDIVRAYSRIMLSRLETQQKRQVLPSELRGTRVVELTIKQNDALNGQILAELALPENALVITVERGNEVLVPHGSTELLAGDTVMILVQHDAVADLHERLAALRKTT